MKSVLSEQFLPFLLKKVNRRFEILFGDPYFKHHGHTAARFDVGWRHDYSGNLFVQERSKHFLARADITSHHHHQVFVGEQGGGPLTVERLGDLFQRVDQRDIAG